MGLQGQVQCVGLLQGVDTRSVGWWRSTARSAVAREARFFVEYKEKLEIKKYFDVIKKFPVKRDIASLFQTNEV